MIVVTLGEKPRHVPDVTYELSLACFVKKCKRNFMKFEFNTKLKKIEASANVLTSCGTINP
ncbi:MAG: hypothetical protein NC092_10485, partial [Butyrivibrio sp.]|nr:hypothetical protein [Muribaculum sp.]MCM1553106.1 hypothetical protein [Butyrivibrio sp.]